MATFTWSIANLESNTADGGVVVAHWRCDGVEGELSQGAYGTVSFTPDASADGYVAYADLTEETVLGWVHGELSKDDVETAITNKLAQLANPPTQSGLPWAASEG